MPPDLDSWLARPLIRIRHRRVARVTPEALWNAARTVRLDEARRLGRLVRLRIPGLPLSLTFDEMFRTPPFTVLEAGEMSLLSGIVGRIWTMRRDYPSLRDPSEFRDWAARGMARVLFASWTEPSDGGGATLVNETRVDAIGRRGRWGLAAVRPLIAASNGLIASDGLSVAVRRAELDAHTTAKVGR
ncbi:MAG TPA: hypothetical protein VG410_14060 [Solirubrobacteraceae bacterium]|nr:hypothetical protein [Solirubrobacteraceae bacterium]